MKKAVLLLTFNRLDYLIHVFEAVRQAKPPRLYIASDGPRPSKEGEKEKVEEVRNYLLSHVDWDCEVKTRFLETNSGGCAKGVSGAITWFFENEEDGIILEDDILPNPDFFEYCEKMLEHYKNDKDVYSVVGYLPISDTKDDKEYGFASVSHCWGWATWRDKWKIFQLDISDFDESIIDNISSNPHIKKYWNYIFEKQKNKEIDSWYFSWNFCIAKNKGLTIFPKKNLISNIGETGVHYASKDPRLNTPTFSMKVSKFYDTKDIKLMNNVLWKYFYNLQNPFRNEFQPVERKYYFLGYPILSIEEI